MMKVNSQNQGRVRSSSVSAGIVKNIVAPMAKAPTEHQPESRIAMIFLWRSMIEPNHIEQTASISM